MKESKKEKRERKEEGRKGAKVRAREERERRQGRKGRKLERKERKEGACREALGGGTLSQAAPGDHRNTQMPMILLIWKEVSLDLRSIPFLILCLKKGEL